MDNVIISGDISASNGVQTSNVEQLSDASLRHQGIPTIDRMNKVRTINIEGLDRGFIVRVGCQSIAISSKAELISKLVQYINDPDQTEQKYYNNELF